MSLSVRIDRMRYAPRRPDISLPWLRDVLRLPPLKQAEILISDFTLKAEAGEILAVVGASGAGKTTLLRILAGLETSYEGIVFLGPDAITRPDKRIYLLPQTHTLLPWLSVAGNLQFNIGDASGEDAGGRKLLEQFGMVDKHNSYPHSLSGGERARVALMCAMQARPEVLLLDEPFRGLDQITKEKCVDDLMKWIQCAEKKEIVILVSHDIDDAVFLATRVIVVRRDPLRLYQEIPTPDQKSRRSDKIIRLESEVFKLLEEAARMGD